LPISNPPLDVLQALRHVEILLHSRYKDDHGHSFPTYFLMKIIAADHRHSRDRKNDAWAAQVASAHLNEQV
jgi:hypothetical protein